MNGSPHGPLPITGALPDEQRARAARSAVGIAARCGGTRDETLGFLEALGLQDQISALRSDLRPTRASTLTRTRADAHKQRTRQISARNDATQPTPTTEEPR